MSAHLRIVAWCLLLGGLWARTTHAEPILSFSDPQNFSNTVQIVRTETFDEFATDTVIGIGSVTLDGIIYTSSNPLGILLVAGIFVTPLAHLTVW